MRAVFFVLIFLLIGAFFIISNENLHLRSNEDFMKFGNSYYAWFGKLYENIGSIGGFIVKTEWLPSGLETGSMGIASLK